MQDIKELDGLDLTIQRDTRRQELINEAKQLSILGIDWADMKRTYGKAFSTNILILRKDQVPATLCIKLSQGDKDVARARFDRDVAEILYYACRENLMILKKEVQIIENEIEAVRKGI